ncbi:PREDICTED: uncharacterized protein LOC105148528 [Acromyrmex echinatior]|uniref:uncharacterized protein LOC105148528 n=1 Tax=Acromyrmex echinatior TaxID=103372 RepID=UPI000580D7D7|nr:PREDICTED: uncharacterized protein LOC105148528 [Acromyrmex echinatior]
MRNQFLINEKEQVAKNLYKIEYKFKIDRERFKKELYNHVLNLVSIFQVEILNHMPCSIPNLLSENIAVKNQLSMIMENAASKTQDYSLLSNAAKEHKREIRNIHLRTTRSTVISELEKSIITMLRNIRKVANVNLSKLDKFNYFTEEQYMMNKDNARILADKCEIRLKNIELLLYCEKEKLNNAKNQKRWLSNQLQEQLQILYDVKHVLKQFKINDHEQQK